jgi:uncharacterized damage-inducible protein DinB
MAPLTRKRRPQFESEPGVHMHHVAHDRRSSPCRILLTIGLLAVCVPGAAAQSAPSSLPGDLRPAFEDAAGKAVALAKAIPAEKYGWRPAPGVRSIGEVFVHMANGNRLLLTFAAPHQVADADLRNLIADNELREKSLVQKEDIVRELEASFEEVRRAAAAVAEQDLARIVRTFGQERTVRSIYVLIATHAGEHVGQSIAYARMNGITPPWSAAQ